MSLKIILWDGKTSIPQNEKIVYVVAKNGIYQYKNLKTIESLTKIDNIPFLADVQTFAKFKFPIIPKEILAQAVGFLKYVFDEHSGSEGGLLILFDQETKLHSLHAPKQKVSPGSARWDNTPEMEHFGKKLLIGTIHSHGSGGPFHSGIDIDDEKNFNGIHITMGYMGKDIKALVASIVVDGNRFKIKSEEIKNYLEIIPIEEENKERINYNPPIYEEYQATLANRHWEPYWKCDKWESTFYSSEGIRFTIDVEPKYFDFPYEWKECINRPAQSSKIMIFSKGKLISFEEFRKNKYGKNTPSVGEYKTIIPKSEILSKEKNIDCDDCIYLKTLLDAIQEGIIDPSDLGESGEIFEDQLTDEQYEEYMKSLGVRDEFFYGEHIDEESYEDLRVDEHGNIVNSKGIIVCPHQGWDSE